MIPGLFLLFADLEYMARTVYGEARGETFEGKVAVACVIVNRALKRHRRENRIAGVATEPYQFSCWLDTDANQRKLLTVDLGDPAFFSCVQACLVAIEQIGALRDPTHGADHYHTIDRPRWAETWPPTWANGAEPVATIDDHVFYALVA